jgi:hypothetical protein
MTFSQLFSCSQWNVDIAQVNLSSPHTARSLPEIAYEPSPAKSLNTFSFHIAL